ncbi:Alpha-actinin-2 [Echinococcus granulosus]|uniref:Alpha-actinin-2 n=1 Tax=Echinococcus granulosus TaxID=6210 RepID=W6UEB2_ECHGR|nr:Alpha-actinin-2 [Echinococcus granulosus]EUB59226.1 Alpha-actinin-2 [Echinococcus granulosus]
MSGNMEYYYNNTSAYYPNDAYYGTHIEPEEEEEWDRESYLDPMWEIQQKKTFTAWCNSYLRKANTNITDIENDFRDGLKLLQLLETLAEEPLPKPDRGKMRFHMITNVNKALKYIESKGVQLVSIGAEQIVDGNIKMTLGMIWTIILRFCIQDITVEELHAKEGLLLWCQRKTAPYSNVNVQNFHTSWKDGLAFCALIHRHRPDLIDYAKLSKENPIQNLNYAFDVAEKYLDIPKMLDAEDMVNTIRPDERSVMTYVAAYYHAFANAHNTESAANKIAKVLKSNQDTEKLMQEYAALASDLLKWINNQIPFLADKTTDGTLPHAKEKLAQYTAYGGSAKPPRVEDKALLEALNNTIQTRLKLAHKPAFMPPAGQSIDWLLNEIRRLEQLDYLVKKFRLKCSTHEAWSKDKEATLSTRDYENASYAELTAMAQKQNAFETDLGAHQNRVERIVSIAEELNALQYEDVISVNKRTQDIVSQWDRLGEISARRKEEIDKRLEVLKKIDNLQQSFARRVGPFSNWLEQAEEDLQDMFIADRVEEVSQLINGHEAFKRALPAAQEELNSMLREAGEIDRLVEQHDLPREVAVNPYTMITHETLHDRWGCVQKLVPERDSALESELAKQQRNEQLRAQFAMQANRLGPWLERALDALFAAQSNPTTASLEQQMGGFKRMEEELEKMKPVIMEAERCYQQLHIRNQTSSLWNFKAISTLGSLDDLDFYSFLKQLQENGVYTVPQTQYTMDTLRLGWEQFLTNLKRAINEVEVQIMTREAHNISEAQLNDFRRCFNHFDRKRLRRLDLSEFKACLVSLGFNIPNTPEGDADFRRILANVDPSGSGYITFDSFMRFMTQQASGSESAEQLIDSFRVLANEQPFVTAETIQRELPPEQAEYCLQKMKPYSGNGAVPGALDYSDFSNKIFGETDL